MRRPMRCSSAGLFGELRLQGEERASGRAPARRRAATSATRRQLGRAAQRRAPARTSPLGPHPERGQRAEQPRPGSRGRHPGTAIASAAARIGAGEERDPEGVDAGQREHGPSGEPAGRPRAQKHHSAVASQSPGVRAQRDQADSAARTCPAAARRGSGQISGRGDARRRTRATRLCGVPAEARDHHVEDEVDRGHVGDEPDERPADDRGCRSWRR